MTRWRIEFEPEFRESPLSYWVHVNVDHEIWVRASQFEPALPEPIAGKGYARLVVDAFGVQLEFASLQEARHFREVLSQKNLPSSLRLVRKRSASAGPNRHWLSRLPARLKPWRTREKLLPSIDAGIAAMAAAFERPKR